jgi:hypothetical protein
MLDDLAMGASLAEIEYFRQEEGLDRAEDSAVDSMISRCTK